MWSVRRSDRQPDLTMTGPDPGFLGAVLRIVISKMGSDGHLNRFFALGNAVGGALKADLHIP
jgi:hypothetical protein